MKESDRQIRFYLLCCLFSQLGSTLSHRHEKTFPWKKKVDDAVLDRKLILNMSKSLIHRLKESHREELPDAIRLSIPDIGLVVRVFANGQEDLGSIPGRVIPKTQKMVLDARRHQVLSIIRYGSRVKWSNPGEGVAPSLTPWCSKLSKRKPSGHPRLGSPTLLTFIRQKVAEIPPDITLSLFVNFEKYGRSKP